MAREDLGRRLSFGTHSLNASSLTGRGFDFRPDLGRFACGAATTPSGKWAYETRLPASTTASTAIDIVPRLPRAVSSAQLASCAARSASISFFLSSSVSAGGAIETVSLSILPSKANGTW